MMFCVNLKFGAVDVRMHSVQVFTSFESATAFINKCNINISVRGLLEKVCALAMHNDGRRQ